MQLLTRFASFAFAATSGCAVAAATGPDGAAFETYEIITTPAAHQTVLIGAFAGDGRAQLALIDIDATGERRLWLYGFDGDGWKRLHDAPFPADVLYVDVAHGADRDRLIAYRPGSFHWIDPINASELAGPELATGFSAPADAGVPQLDVARDLNGDGRDDLLVPDRDGFWVMLQSGDGSFTEPVKLGPREPFLGARAYDDERTYGEVGITAQNTPWYLGRVHQLDFDRDGREDLVFWNADHFVVHRQDDSGSFSRSPESFTTDVAFDFDGAYGLAFQFGDASTAALLLGLRARTEHRILHGFRDLNADGVVDMMILALAGRSPLRLRGQYDVHFGRPMPGGTVFLRPVDTSISAPRRSGGLQPWGYAAQHFPDFDGDGALDITMTAVNTRLGGMFRAIVGNSVSMELAVYRLTDDGYPARPDVTRRLGSPFRPFDRRGPLLPTVLVGDVNGDGRSDLVTGDRWDELAVFLGQSGPDPLASQAIKIPLAIPAGKRNTRLADLDGDGKQDVIVHHQSPTQAGRLTVLMSRGVTETRP